MLPRLCDVSQTHHCIKSSFSKTWTYLLGTFWHPSSQDISSMGCGLITLGLLLNQSTFACCPHPPPPRPGDIWQCLETICGCHNWRRKVLLTQEVAPTHLTIYGRAPPPTPSKDKHKRQWCQGWENLHQDNSDPSLKSYRELGPCSQHCRFL